jgi:hypothetical protein
MDLENAFNRRQPQTKADKTATYEHFIEKSGFSLRPSAANCCF